MSIERPLYQAKQQIQNSFLKSELGGKAMSFAMREFAKSGTEMFELVDPNDYLGEFSEYIEDGYYPIVISNHLSLADIGAVVKIADKINQNLSQSMEFNLPASISLNKKQGDFVDKFYASVRPWVASHNINLIEVARKKDRDEHKFEETLEEAQEVHDTFYTDKGLIIFIEGVQEGGRTNKITGEINGMREITNKQVPEQIKDCVGYGREVVIIPAGIESSFRIFDPNKGSLPLEVLESLAYQKVLRTDPKLASVTIGKPFTSKDIEAAGVSLENLRAVNDYLAKDKIAPLLSENTKGVYK